VNVAAGITATFNAPDFLTVPARPAMPAGAFGHRLTAATLPRPR
jgi:hypothetical protein